MSDHLQFTPARMGRAGEDVALQIEAAILAGKIQPGESLPSERELREQFQTGRGVIREAMRALKEKGLIEIRKGARGGAFVKEAEVANASESLALFLKQQNVSPDYLVEFRESIDRAITVLAIARADPAEKADFEREASALADLLDAAETDMEALVETDRRLNIKLARMSRNPIFEWVMGAIQLGFSSHDHALYAHPHYRGETVANWRETTRQIAANEPTEALSSISRHYILLRSCLRERPGGRG
jgi:GntR family transcriptional regulator, transcriptional repressor for pyruvate dehydrogenase complex